MPISRSVLLVWERMNNAKHLQMVSGVDKLMFWITSYLSDLITYTVPFAVIMILFAAFNLKEVAIEKPSFSRYGFANQNFSYF